MELGVGWEQDLINRKRGCSASQLAPPRGSGPAGGGRAAGGGTSGGGARRRGGWRGGKGARCERFSLEKRAFPLPGRAPPVCPAAWLRGGAVLSRPSRPPPPAGAAVGHRSAPRAHRAAFRPSLPGGLCPAARCGCGEWVSRRQFAAPSLRPSGLVLWFPWQLSSRTLALTPPRKATSQGACSDGPTAGAAGAEDFRCGPLSI